MIRFLALTVLTVATCALTVPPSLMVHLLTELPKVEQRVLHTHIVEACGKTVVACGLPAFLPREFDLKATEQAFNCIKHRVLGDDPQCSQMLARSIPASFRRRVASFLRSPVLNDIVKDVEAAIAGRRPAQPHSVLGEVVNTASEVVQSVIHEDPQQALAELAAGVSSVGQAFGVPHLEEKIERAAKPVVEKAEEALQQVHVPGKVQRAGDWLKHRVKQVQNRIYHFQRVVPAQQRHQRQQQQQQQEKPKKKMGLNLSKLWNGVASKGGEWFEQVKANVMKKAGEREEAGMGTGMQWLRRKAKNVVGQQASKEQERKAEMKAERTPERKAERKEEMKERRQEMMAERKAAMEAARQQREERKKARKEAMKKLKQEREAARHQKEDRERQHEVFVAVEQAMHEVFVAVKAREEAQDAKRANRQQTRSTALKEAKQRMNFDNSPF